MHKQGPLHAFRSTSSPSAHSDTTTPRNRSHPPPSDRHPHSKLLQALLHHNRAAVHNAARPRHYTRSHSCMSPGSSHTTTSRLRISRARDLRAPTGEHAPVCARNAMFSRSAASESDSDDSYGGEFATPRGSMHSTRSSTCCSIRSRHRGEGFQGVHADTAQDYAEVVCTAESLISELEFELSEIADMRPPRAIIPASVPGGSPSPRRALVAHASAASLQMRTADTSPTHLASFPTASNSRVPQPVGPSVAVDACRDAANTRCGHMHAAHVCTEACSQSLANWVEQYSDESWSTASYSSCASSTVAQVLLVSIGDRILSSPNTAVAVQRDAPRVSPVPAGATDEAASGMSSLVLTLLDDIVHDTGSPTHREHDLLLEVATSAQARGPTSTSSLQSHDITDITQELYGCGLCDGVRDSTMELEDDCQDAESENAGSDAPLQYHEGLGRDAPFVAARASTSSLEFSAHWKPHAPPEAENKYMPPEAFCRAAVASEFPADVSAVDAERAHSTHIPPSRNPSEACGKPEPSQADSSEVEQIAQPFTCIQLDYLHSTKVASHPPTLPFSHSHQDTVGRNAVRQHDIPSSESHRSSDIVPPSESNLSSDNSISAAPIFSSPPMAPARTLGPVPEQSEVFGGASDAVVPADAAHDGVVHGTQHEHELPPQIPAALELDQYGARGGDKGVHSEELRVVYGSSGSVTGPDGSPASEQGSCSSSSHETVQNSVTEVVLDMGPDDSPVAEGGISSPPLHMQVQSCITEGDTDTSSAEASLGVEEGRLASESSVGDAPLQQHPTKDTVFAAATEYSTRKVVTARGAKFPSGRMHVQMFSSYLRSCLRRLVARSAAATEPRHAWQHASESTSEGLIPASQGALPERSGTSAKRSPTSLLAWLPCRIPA